MVKEYYDEVDVMEYLPVDKIIDCNVKCCNKQ